jgi:protein SCO1
MNRTQLLAFATIAIVAIIAGALLSQLVFKSPAGVRTSTATVIQPARAIPAFSLQTTSGSTFTPASLRDHWSFVFFGYTSCPDICPLTLSVLAKAQKELADLSAGDRPQIVFVSVDSKRDTPEHLGEYVRYFDPGFVGVTGEQTALEKFALSLGAPVALTSQSDGSYTVDHSAALFLVNRKGELQAVFSPPHTAESIASDYRLLVHAG